MELAADQRTTEERLSALEKKGNGYWAGDHVGITRDGYVFYYDIHSSHMEGDVEDINVFYLPDEDRFVYNLIHYCCGPNTLSKAVQPENKDELMRMID